MWWLGAVATFVVVSTQLDLAVGFEVVSFDRELLRQFLYGLVGVGLVAPIALVPGAGRGLRSVLDLRPIASLGRISYGVYLWHVAVMTWLLDWTDWARFDAPFAALLAGGVALSVLVAATSRRVIEAPLLARFGPPSGRRPGRPPGLASTSAVGAAPDP